MMATIYGVPPSPYVRKTLLAHAVKGISVELKLTMPGSDEPEFRAASPFGKIPAYRLDDTTAFSDSSVIIAYLERTNSTNSLYPEDAADYAIALALEEYSDTKFSEVVSALYYQRIIGPMFFQHDTDQARVDDLLTNLIPAQLDYLEKTLGENSYFVGNSFSIADLSIGSHMLSLYHTKFDIDTIRWPAVAAFNDAFLARTEVKEQLAQELAVFGK